MDLLKNNEFINDVLGMNQRSDQLILPVHYNAISEPYYSGQGNHSIKELEAICAQYKEYCHQQAIIKIRLIEKIRGK